MIYLVLAIASSAAISILMRASEKYVKNEMGMFMANYAVCMLMSFLFMKNMAQVGQLGSSAGRVALVLGILSGVMYLANFLFYKYNMKHNGIVMSATFMKLGVLVPTIMAVLVFKESLSGFQFVGIMVAISAIVLIHFEKNAFSESKHMVGLLLLLLLSGLTDSMANVFEKLGNADTKDAYLLVTFGMAFLITVLLIIFRKIRVGKQELLFGALIGIPNYFSSRFLLLALEEIDAVLVYPTYSVATMIVIMLAGVCVFHENMSKKKFLAVGMIIVALGLLNS
ncbi:MAG: hypothetical protein IJ958_01150 [Agathobacter sp.]|nr:hypothetical protein [Agathobacter sp.]